MGSQGEFWGPRSVSYDHDYISDSRLQACMGIIFEPSSGSVTNQEVVLQRRLVRAGVIKLLADLLVRNVSHPHYYSTMPTPFFVLK